mgnify:CR=1 FL=1
MADTKISALTEMTTTASGDYVPIIDVSEASNANKNKRLTLATLLNKASDGSAGSPTFGFQSDSGNSGVYRSAANEVGFAVSSTYKGAFSATGFKLGTGTAAAQLHLFSNDTTDQVIIENTDTGVDTAPDLVLFRNSASPATNDNLGNLEFRGEDSAGNTHAYAQVVGGIKSTTNTGEDGILDLMSSSGGTSASRLRLYGQYVGIGESTPAYPLHLTTAVAGTALRLECSTNDASSGGDLTLFRRRGASGAGQDNDLVGTVYYRGKNDDTTPEQVDYACVEGSIVDASDGTEDGRLRMKVQTAGTITTQLTLEPTVATFANDVSIAGDVTIADAKNIVLNTTTGTKIGTATGQKLGFYNATPIVQGGAVSDINHTTSSGTLPTADGNLTIANAASPSNAELLNFCVELEAKVELLRDRLKSVGLTA